MKQHKSGTPPMDGWTLNYETDGQDLIVECGHSAIGKLIYLEDIYGRILMHQQIEKLQFKFSVYFLPKGVYWVHIDQHGSQKWMKS